MTVDTSEAENIRLHAKIAALQLTIDTLERRLKTKNAECNARASERATIARSLEHAGYRLLPDGALEYMYDDVFDKQD